MADLTLVYSYYKNTNMFKIQQRIWGKYTDKMKKAIEVIVTDDCSPKEGCLENAIVQPVYPNLRCFKIKEKVPWNWLQCRNIGGHYANSPWILLTDMDHVLTYENARGLLKRLPSLEKNVVYQLRRIREVDQKPYKHHNDSFIVSKELFWLCGAYDEHYSGLYGTSGKFRRRLFRHAKENKMIPLDLVLYGREVIPDASTTDFKRKEGRDPNWMKERHASHPGGFTHFKYPYEEIRIERA